MDSAVTQGSEPANHASKLRLMNPPNTPPFSRARRRRSLRAMLPARAFLAALGLALSVLGPSLPAAAQVRDEAVEALQARDFEKAASLLEAQADNDEAAHLRAVALFHAGRMEEAAAAAALVGTRFPESTWSHKARFLEARALIELRRHREAEAIFAAEADRIFSGDRKHRLASTLVEFGDLLSREADPGDLDALPPDHERALQLYRQVLELEVSRDFRDDVLFKVGRAQASLEQHADAVETFRAYLLEYDPAWSGPVGTGARQRGHLRDDPVAPGRHRHEARLALVRSQSSLGHWKEARQNADDLAALLEQAIAQNDEDPAREGDDGKSLAALLAEARWERLATFQSESDPDARIAAARAFLAAHPAHARAPETSLEIARLLEQAGRADEAVAAYQDFVGASNYHADAAEPDASRADDRTGISPAEELENRRQEAFFRIGRIRFDQKDYDKAIAQWEEYVTRHPNGAQWSDAQSGIVDAQFETALDAVARGDEATARRHFEEFLRRHPLDPRCPRVLFTLGQMHATAGDVAEEADGPDTEQARARFRQAIAEWSRLIGKYPASEEASLALYRTGVLQSEKLGRMEEALASFRRLDWGSWAGPASARVAMLSERSLGVATERVFRTDETPEIRVTVRNIESLEVSLYPLNLEGYFRKTHGLERIDHLDIDLIEPSRRWEVPVENYQKHQALEQAVPVPFEGEEPGIYVAKVEGGDWTATTLVIRSDIDLILKSTRREALVYAEDRRRGRPAAGVDLLLSDGTGIIATGRTGEDGVFRTRLPALEAAGSLRVLATSPHGAASNLLSLDQLRLGTGLTPRGHLYTDKPAYLPGESVALRGVVRDVSDGSYVVPAQKDWLLQIMDPAGRLFVQTDVALSDFGTLDTTVTLPAESPLGTYAMVATSRDRKLAFNGSFHVAEFKLDRVRLAFEFPREVYFRNEVIEGTLQASWYWGAPAAEQIVQLSLPDGRIIEAKTDAQGTIPLRFDPAGFHPGQPLAFRAALPALNIESSDSIFLAEVGFAIAVEPQQPLALGGEPFEVKVRTTGADGSPVGRPLTVSVLRRAPPKTDRTLEAVPWIRHAPAPAADVTVEEHRLETDADTGEAAITLAFEQGGRYTIRVAGTDRFGQAVTGAGTVTISDDEDSSKLRFFADHSTYDVGAPLPLRLHSRIASGLALLTVEGEEILSHRVVSLHEGHNPVDLTLSHEHFPNFQVSVALMDGPTLRSASKQFTVRRELRVDILPAKETFLPGETTELEVITTDQLGRPVAAELSLALVNAALHDAFTAPGPTILDFFQEGARRFTDFSLGSTCGFFYTARSMRLRKADPTDTGSYVVAGNTVEQLHHILCAELDLNPTNTTLFTDFHRNSGSLFNNDRALMPSNAAGDFGNGIAQMVQARGGAAATQAAGLFIHAGLPTSDPHSATAMVDAGVDPFSSEPHLEFGVNGAVDGGLQILDRAERLTARTANAPGLSPAPTDADALVANTSAEAAPRIERSEASRWISPITTDGEGRAHVRVVLPDSASTWRLTAKGCTRETLVGESSVDVVTRKDFFVELRVPETLQEGDVVPFLAVVHNLTDAEGEVAVTLAVEGAPEPFTSVRTAILRPRGSTEILLDPFTVPGTGAVRLTIDAQAGANLADTAARTLPIKPWGLEYASQAAGITDTGTGAALALPDGQRYASRRLTLTLSPSVEQALIDLALERPTPHTRLGAGSVSCLVRPEPQSPASALVASASALIYARERRADAADLADLAARVRTLVSALVVSQGDDGSWPWNSLRGDANLASTATGYWGLVLAVQAGIEVHPATLDAAEARLRSHFPQIEPDDFESKAVLLHALALRGAADFSNANRLYRERASLGEAALAYLAAAFVRMERDGFARDLLALLASRAASRNAGGREQVYWKSERRGSALSPTADETTAMILWCHARLDRGAPVAARAAEYLLTEAVRPGSARSLGPIIHALAAYHSDGERLEEDFEVVLTLNDRPLHRITSRELRGTRSFEVPESAILAGTNSVRIDVTGRGRIRYAATLSGFSPDMTDPESFETPHFVERQYHHDRLRYRDVPLDATSTSPVTRLSLGQRFRTVVSVHNRHAHQDYLVWEENFPSGALLVRDSVRGNFDRLEHREGRLVLHFKPGTVGSLSYELVAHAPGRYRILPSVLRDSADRGRMRIGKAAELEILAPEIESPDPYRMNRHERFELATKLFDDGRFTEAVEHLDTLYNDPAVRRLYEKDLARMLLWIHTRREPLEPARIVEVFEVLRERHPDLVIPFDRILVVGRAYRELEEFERAWLVFRAAIQSSFLNDARISAVLEDQGQFLGSVSYQKRLWAEYPDGADVATALFGLSQSLFQRAPEADRIAAQERRLQRRRPTPPETGTDPARTAHADAEAETETDPDALVREHPETLAMLRESASLLRTFLTHYPTDPLSDDAAFSEVNVHFALKDYPSVVDRAERAMERHTKSEFLSSFQYMAALGHFWQRHFDEALGSAVAVAQGESRDRDYARYITAQIHHATGNPPEAMKWYREVSGLYPDAAEAIAYFEESRIALPEITTSKPGDPATDISLPLAFRNIREAVLQVYKVDLLQLYLREKNLSAITSIDLAGVDPAVTTTVELGDGRDFTDRTRDVPLTLPDAGAYLVICRGDDLFTSGLVLVTPLKLEIQENPSAGSVRVNVRSSVEEAYVPEAEVRVVGSAGSQIVGGETDLRGIFEAEGIHGTATVIARAGEGQYAFFRGTTQLGNPPPPEPTQTLQQQAEQQTDAATPPAKGKQLDMSDYLQNIDASNKLLQDANFKNWDTLRRGDNRGVEVKAAQ